VSANSTTKSIAGALAYLAREHRSVRIVCGSAACVNTALKASATARRYVEAETDLYILPRWVSPDVTAAVGNNTWSCAIAKLP
jgi:stage V sporulation protein SpoVS